MWSDPSIIFNVEFLYFLAVAFAIFGCTILSSLPVITNTGSVTISKSIYAPFYLSKNGSAIWKYVKPDSGTSLENSLSLSASS